MKKSIQVMLFLAALAIPVNADCPAFYQIDDPPCVCTTIKVTDSSGACFASGHYEDSCTGETTGYWMWVC